MYAVVHLLLAQTMANIRWEVIHPWLFIGEQKWQQRMQGAYCGIFCVVGSVFPVAC